jgi:hypothetical protein
MISMQTTRITAAAPSRSVCFISFLGSPST